MMTPKKYALVICDMQSDFLGSITDREYIMSTMKLALGAARQAGWLIAFSGLKFLPGYVGVSSTHKLYGGLVKLNQKLGDKGVHWLMQGYEGSNIVMPIQEGEHVVWRQQHTPLELQQLLSSSGITNVYVAGIKTSGAIQITCQLLMDKGLDVSVIRECVQDDDPERCAAVMQMLPLYAAVVSLDEMIDDAVGGMSVFLNSASEDLKQSTISLAVGGRNEETPRQHCKTFLCTNCGRIGLGHRYIQLLLERPEWRELPTQVWYEDFVKEYHCPLAERVVDFCDEPKFSKVSMYLAGREWLDDKAKVVSVAGKYMPDTFCVKNKEWVGGRQPQDDTSATMAPWFVKESDKNLGGAAIQLCRRPSEVLGLVREDVQYVVQQHIIRPLLTDDGRKAHVKFYALLICEEDGRSWKLYAYRGSLVCISPNIWSSADLSQDTQVTIHRHPKPPNEIEGWKQYWPDTYEKCKQGTADVIRNAITGGMLKGRQGKKQFEVFSVDWMPDELGNVWMFEFNMSPAISQREYDDDSACDERRRWLMQRDEDMLRDALSVAMPWEGGTQGMWELAAHVEGGQVL